MKNITLAVLVFFSAISSSSAEPTKFIVDDPGGRNTVEFNSEAPIEVIVGTTNQISGNITFDPMDVQQAVSGRITVDLNTLTTGIALRDEHMKSDGYLNTAIYPLAEFDFDSPLKSDITKIEPGKPFDFVLGGKFSLHGVTRSITVTGKASYFKEVKELVDYGYPGDMISFNGAFQVKLSDYNINRPQMLMMKLAEDINVRVNFTATTGR